MFTARFNTGKAFLKNICYDLQGDDWKWVGSATTKFNTRLVYVDDNRICNIDTFFEDEPHPAEAKSKQG